MRVLLLHLDGKLPNIALMRLAAHHRALGPDVTLRRAGNAAALEPWLDDPTWDLVYVSLIFEATRELARRALTIYPNALIGGTGWDLTTRLEDHGITTRRQDYSIYPLFKSSIGFSQRGCRLRCGFCVVTRKEGGVAPDQTIQEIWRGDPSPREIILLDNDFFGQPAWKDRIAELRDGAFKVSFSQGINARMLTEETAAAIASVDYRDNSMRERRIYTAWDNRNDEERLWRGLEALVHHGVSPRHIMVYMLVGYWPGETHEDREYRRARLRAFGALPYPMPFVRTPELIGYQRWVIGAYDKGISWTDWSRARWQPRRLDARRSSQLRVFE